MNNQPPLPSHSEPTTPGRIPPDYVALIERAVVGIEPTTVRLYRREARRFAAWCGPLGIDPLRPPAEWVTRYLAEVEATPRRAACIRSALRAVVRAAGVPTDEHGLGAGNVSSALARIDPGTKLVFDHVLGESRVERRAIIRSGLAKLAAWALECEVDLLALAPADLDDYARWLLRVGNDPTGELMVIARKHFAASMNPTLRREAGRRRARGSGEE